MSHLSESMDTGIGSAGSLHLDVAVKHFRAGFSQLAHDGSRILLFLPAAVARAVILDQEFERRHLPVAPSGGTWWRDALLRRLFERVSERDELRFAASHACEADSEWPLFGIRSEEHTSELQSLRHLV